MDPAASRLAEQLAHGLIPAVPAPHRADGRYDAEAQESYAAWMAEQDVAGVTAWAHTGRGLYLDEEVAARVLSSWRRALPAGKVLIAGAGARPKRRRGKPGARQTPPADPTGLTGFVVNGTIEMASQAKSLGADAILVFPPVLLRDLGDRDRRFVEVHVALADLGLPVIAFYLYEAAGGCCYSERVLDRILALPHVAGIKVATLDSVVTFQQIAARVPQGRLLLSGEDRFLGYSLMMGARAALVGMGAAVTGLQAALVKAHGGGDAARFLELSALCDRLGATTFCEPTEGYIRRLLWALALEGVIPRESAFDPWGPEVPGHQLDQVEVVLQQLAAWRNA